MIKLRDYQERLKQKIYKSWEDASNTAAVSPCGSGKTVLFSDITDDFYDPVALVAHRQELVAQISTTLALQGVKHNIIAPKSVIKYIIRQHVDVTGHSYYNNNSLTAVAGVDTLVRRKDLESWAKKIGLWIQDECHHILAHNKWGKAAAMFPHAKGLGVTATLTRADGKGLGMHADGVFHQFVEGETLRWMIDQGYLTDYQIFNPPSDVDFSGLKPTASGDYNPKLLRQREEQSHIFGDVVEHFNRIAAGKQGITFASNVKSAIEFSDMFNSYGVKARMVSGETPDRERIETDRLFRKGEIRQMTNVDLFGEGYDLPILDCVTMARKTESFGLFVQQATRALRPSYAPGMPLDTREQRLAAIAAGSKPKAYIIDHVNNVERHAVAVNGVVDLCYANWSLDRRERRSNSDKPEDGIPVKSCTECAATYEAILPACPFCGNKPKPIERKTPEQVEGDLTELDPSSLRQIIAEVEEIKKPFTARSLTPNTENRRNQHNERQIALGMLEESIAYWAGKYRAQGENDQKICKRFYYRFGVDLVSCKKGTTQQSIELSTKIMEDMKC